MISIYPEYESIESRLARNDWQSRILGYRYTIRYDGKTKTEVENCLSYEAALEDAQNQIDALVGSL